MRLHQFAYNPSVHKPNPYVDVSKLNLDPYMADMFGQEALADARPEALDNTISVSMNASIDDSPERLSAPAWVPVTPVNSMPLFNAGCSQHDQSLATKHTAHGLKIYTGPTPPPTCVPSPRADAYAAVSLRPIPLQFMSVFAQGSPLSVGHDDDIILSPTESFSSDEGDDHHPYKDLPCPSSDFSQDHMSSPMVFDPPFDGLPTPEDALDFGGTLAYGPDFTPAPSRYPRQTGGLSLLSPPPSDVKRKRGTIDDGQRDDLCLKAPRIEVSLDTPQCTSCKSGDSISCLGCVARQSRHSSSPSSRKTPLRRTLRRDMQRNQDAKKKKSEWLNSSDVDDFDALIRSSPIPFDGCSSPLRASLYDSDSDETLSMRDAAKAVYLTPVAGTKPAAISPARHFVSPHNIFAPERPSTR
ncbi:hypothetical protein HDU87_007807 [Geranomyces variabilis]|uniref:Uncharacterized protein n=1 Tax=Geranomyces variabilis TaxID=109894 RepID=A0AAD5TDE2_9FUNG|nr:hypothetical protein HDU87_007807 [Geranomyces variabilis]